MPFLAISQCNLVNSPGVYTEVYKNTAANTADMINLRITPSDPGQALVHPLAVGFLVGGNQFILQPTSQYDKTFELFGLVANPGLSISITGGQQIVRVEGFRTGDEANWYGSKVVPSPGAGERATTFLFKTNETMNAVLDQFVQPPAQISSPMQIGIKIRKTGTVGAFTYLTQDRAYYQTDIMRKIVVPAGYDVYSEVLGNISPYYQWGLQKSQDDAGISL